MESRTFSQQKLTELIAGLVITSWEIENGNPEYTMILPLRAQCFPSVSHGIMTAARALSNTLGIDFMDVLSEVNKYRVMEIKYETMYQAMIDRAVNAIRHGVVSWDDWSEQQRRLDIEQGTKFEELVSKALGM